MKNNMKKSLFISIILVLLLAGVLALSKESLIKASPQIIPNSDHPAPQTIEVSSCQALNMPYAIYKQSSDIIIPQNKSVCINITAPYVTFDGNGYIIKANNPQGALKGIYSNQMKTTIKNIKTSMQNTGINTIGVYLEGANESSLINSYNELSHTGVYLSKTYKSNLVNLTVYHGGTGIYLVNSGENVITHTKVSDLYAIGGSGILMENSNNNTITDSEVLRYTGISSGIYFIESSYNNIINAVLNENEKGLSLGSASNNNYLENITANNNINQGISIENSDNNLLKDINSKENFYGIFLLNAKSNIISNANTLNNERGGVYFQGASYNYIENFASQGNRFGLYFDSGASSNQLINGSIIQSTESNIQITDPFLVANPLNNSFSFISTSQLAGVYDLQIAGVQGNKTTLINTAIKKYKITSPGSTLTFIEINKGKIEFTGAIQGNGENLGNNINIQLNRAYFNESISGINKKATITLENVPNFANPKIIRNGIKCPNNICTPLTPLNQSTVSFSVKKGGAYSIGQI